MCNSNGASFLLQPKALKLLGMEVCSFYFLNHLPSYLTLPGLMWSHRGSCRMMNHVRKEEGKRTRRRRRSWMSMWTTLRSAGSSIPSTSWWFGLCWQSARRWPCSCGNTGRRPWPRPWWPANCTRLWPTSPPRANWWMIFFRIWRTIPGESQKDEWLVKMWMMAVVCMCPAQGIWPVGLWTAGSVLQTRWAGGHEVADIRAEELEQLHVSEAGCRCQTSWLHRSHLQPDAADWHVDGLPEDGEEQQSEGDQWHKWIKWHKTIS